MRRPIEDTLSLLAGAGIGMAVMYLMDPQNGPKRRRQIAHSTRQTFDDASDAISRTARSAMSRLSEVGEDLSNTTRHGSSRLGDAGESIGESIGSAWKSLRGSTADQSERTSERIGEYADTIRSMLRRQARNVTPRRWRSSSRRWQMDQASDYVAPAAGGLGILLLGAGAMYLFDPDRGRSRRAYLRDKAYSIANDMGSFMQKTGRHLSNRLRGTVAEGQAAFRRRPTTDEQLLQRVRSQIGRAGHGARALEVNAHEGHITLHGSLPGEVIESVIGTVNKVRGVRSVDCQITPAESPTQGEMSSNPATNI